LGNRNRRIARVVRARAARPSTAGTRSPKTPKTAGATLLAFERLLAELSAGFVNIPPAAVDGAINDALRRIAAHLGVDRSQVIRYTPDGGAAITHSGAVRGVKPASPRSVADDYPWIVRAIRAGRTVAIPRVDALPPAAAVDRASFERIGVRSNLCTPLKVAGRVEGVLAFGCLRCARDWPRDLVARIRALADVLANALAHKRAQQALDAAVAFERLIARILAALLTAQRDELDGVIEAGLAEMARAFGAERATLWQRVADRTEFVKTHRWLAPGVPVPPDSIGAAALPWLSGELARGAVVRFARLDALPPAAAADLPGLRALGIRAAVAVPLAVSGTVVGALAFAAASEDREWPDELLPRTRLFGEVLAAALARDAAERREQEAQAQAAHAARVGTIGVVAASLVHELTQPLAASLANAETAVELLAEAAPDLDELRATVADIVADDRRVGSLIQQLRRFLRRGEIERAALDLREVTGEALRLARTQAAEHGVEMQLDFADALPRIVADRVQLQQVLLNLLLNAIDAVGASPPDRRRVVVRTRATALGASIEVADSGPGLDAAALARIFEPFFTTKPRGMGLGLSISRSIVAAHGGTLAARSAPGEGATFRVELPLEPPRDAAHAPLGGAPASRDGTVFVIDDDPAMRRAFERQLAGAGYEVASFVSAQDFLDRAPPAAAACIVSDVRMPGLSGLDLHASLAAAGRDLPTVFVSGHGDIPTTVQAMKAGAVAFLTKPASKGELLAAVGDALARSRELALARRERAELEARYGSLTPRERDVLELVTGGLLNKVIADRLGTAEKTIKIHRGRVMEKMAAGSVADLVRMAERLGLARAPEAARG
jgi:FixJ family two-component response regulator/C4-dicarboxylate-specific signal transduction histidine kinase